MTGLSEYTKYTSPQGQQFFILLFCHQITMLNPKNISGGLPCNTSLFIQGPDWRTPSIYRLAKKTRWMPFRIVSHNRQVDELLFMLNWFWIWCYCLRCICRRSVKFVTIRRATHGTIAIISWHAFSPNSHWKPTANKQKFMHFHRMHYNFEHCLFLYQHFIMWDFFRMVPIFHGYSTLLNHS